MANEETEGQQQRPAGYITIPMMVLNGWVGQDERYLKWWMWLRREAAWADREVCYNRQTVYLQMRQVLVTVNSLVKQWGVSKPTVIRFLQRLEQDKLIEREKDTRKTIITITPLGWADLEVKPVVKSEVNSEVKVDHQVDRQAYHSHLLYRDNNIKASVGGARTHEEVVANNLELDFERDDFDEVVAFFNEQMKGKKIPQIAVKTPERRQAYTRLIAETQVGIDSVKQAIINAAASDFLNGSGQKGWIADFDWMMVPQHFQKVLENFYRNKQVTQTTQIQYGRTNGYSDPRRGVEATQVARRRIAYAPNALTSGAIKKLAHFLTDSKDNRFMIVLDGSTATGKTTLMQAMRQTLWWLTENKLVPDDMDLKICDAVALCNLRDSTRDWYELMNWPSFLGIEDLGCEPAEILRWGNPLYPIREVLTTRYEQRLPMVVSTNLDSEQMREHLGLRIVSRMNEMAFYIHFENEDFRKRLWFLNHSEMKSE